MRTRARAQSHPLAAASPIAKRITKRPSARQQAPAREPLSSPDAPASPCSTRPPSPLCSQSQTPPPSPVRSTTASDALSLAFDSSVATSVRQCEAGALHDVLAGDGLKSVYVSGTPGIGKTVTVGRVMRDCVERGIIQLAIVLNCTGLGNPIDFYAALGDRLGVGRTREDVLESATNGMGGLRVLVLDEIDFLSQKTLYEVYDLPAFPQSFVAVVGIANRLDLPLKTLPHLRATNRAPAVIPFKPYTAKDLTTIVQARLSHACSDACAALTPVAISLAAKKVASLSGDARRMLDVCREAVLSLEENPDANAIVVISSILSRGSRVSAAVETIRTLPVQHQLALCCIANAEKRLVAAAKAGHAFTAQTAKRITIGGLYDSFRAMCRKTSLPCIGVSDFTDTLEHLSSSHTLVQISAVKTKTKFGGLSNRGERARQVRLGSISIADVQGGCSENPLLRLLVGDEL